MLSNETRQRRKIILFIVLSALLHLLFVQFLKLPLGVKRQSEPLIVERIILPKDKDKKQVVDDTGKPKDETPPKDSKYLSKYDRSVKEETKAPIVGKTKNLPNLELKKPSKKEAKRPDKKRLSMAGLTRRPQTESSPSSEPSAMSDDYLPDVKSGLETSLNTQEFKYYSYFERIKDRLRMFWEPELKERIQRLYNRGVELPNSDVITKLEIILNKNGEISKISIVRNSGYIDLDEAAIKAFERASPFPNPPSGMVEKDGTVHLTWSFVLQTGIADIFVFLSRR
jgi:protein TonB